MAKKYVVKKGDSLWKIAKDNNITLDELIRLNPTKKDIIYPDDELRLEPDKIKKTVDIRKERQEEDKLNLENITAIQGYHHDSNYVILDKANRKLTIYDKDNKPLYETSDISFGASGNDYNTITYVDANGRIRNMQGNNSTPAGITTITGKGTYHGFPSLTRGRIDNKGNSEDIASSFHWGNISRNKHASNGCVRINGKRLAEMEPLLSTGTRVYTLPEKEGSRFTLRGGKLNFTADNPYGIDKGDKRFWDDYNVTIDKSYAPLKLTFIKTGDEEYDDNRKKFAQVLVNSKRDIQQRFNLSSDEYNRLVDLALGMAEQESKFGTSDKYKYKDWIPDWLLNTAKYISRGKSGARSRGLTQIKIGGDNKEMQDLYKAYGVTEDNITDVDKSALATIIRLANMYNTEVKGRNFTTSDGTQISPYHALMYKWLGKNNELINKTATPDKNIYIRNVGKYSRNFNMYEDREYNVYKLGGRL